MRQCRQDLIATKFLSDQKSSLFTYLKGQILLGDNIPSLRTTYSRVHVSALATTSTTPPSISNDNTAIFLVEFEVVLMAVIMI